MSNEPKDEKNLSPKQAQTDIIPTITLIVAATIGGAQILTGPGRFGLLGSITGLLLLGILLVYGNITYTLPQRLIFSGAVGMSILEIFGFLFNDAFGASKGLFQLNLGDWLTFIFWVVATLITFLIKTYFP